MKGSEVLLGQRVHVYQERDKASRHRHAVVFMDRRFDRGQYEALLMDHIPLDPSEGLLRLGPAPGALPARQAHGFRGTAEAMLSRAAQASNEGRERAALVP
jgi:hypothetical protein